MADTERMYTIPLRRGTMLAPRTRRAKKAIAVLKTFFIRHMKSKDIKLSQQLNEHIWQNGMRNPIMRVSVIARKDDKNVIHVRLSTETTKTLEESVAKPAKKSKASEKETAQEATVVEEKPAAETPKDAAEKPKKAKKAPAKKAE